MGLYAGVTYTIKDRDGKKSTFTVKFPHNVDIGVLQTFATSTAEMIDNLILGQIVDVGISLGVDFGSANIKNAPLSSADVEEGAYFGFRTASTDATGFTIPTFDEAFVIIGSDNVDLSDNDVDDFVQRILAGQTVGLVNVSPSDNRGDDIVAIDVAMETFGARR